MAAEFRLWLRVTMISELANEIGTEIESYKIENDSKWRAESTLRWPNHIEPTNAHRAAFRKGLRESICTTMSPYMRQDKTISLTPHLGNGTLYGGIHCTQHIETKTRYTTGMRSGCIREYQMVHTNTKSH
eukprot:scaffold1363_cov26-Cyclotella_meneghiniana.AAC.1